MLPNEIEPVRDHHIAELESVKELLKNLNFLFTEPNQGIAEAVEKLRSAQHGFTRFAACLADEQATKNRYERQHYEARLQKMREERE